MTARSYRNLALALALILAFFGLQATCAQEPAAPTWTVGQDLHGLEDEIAIRITDGQAAGVLTTPQATALRVQLDALVAKEADLRKTHDLTQAEFTQIHDPLLVLAGQLVKVAPLHPDETPPLGEAWDASIAGQPLDLSGFHITFEDRFDRPSITPDGGDGPWFAPVHTSFGEATFLPPGPDGPFLIGGASDHSGLDIRAVKTDQGWRSGTMQSVDSAGHGFAQRFGYFEIRARLPLGHATWPAFWLLTQNGYLQPDLTRGEIDVLEQYGDEPDRLHCTVHLWPATRRNAGGLKRHWFKSSQINLPGLSSDYHRFGVLVRPDWVTIYYDGAALERFATQAPYDTPLYMVIDLTLFGKSLAAATSPSDFLIDYVRVYAENGPA